MVRERASKRIGDEIIQIPRLAVAVAIFAKFSHRMEQSRNCGVYLA
jgi:hypothetical protein